MVRTVQEKQYDVITFGDMCVDLMVSGEDVAPRFGQVEKLVGDYQLEIIQGQNRITRSLKASTV